jgi:nucleotide-binding universal stress UspA family protein
MKKLLVVFNGINYSSSLSSFAFKLAKQYSAVVHAVFICPSVAEALGYPLTSPLPYTANNFVISREMDLQNQNLTAANIQVFKDTCLDESIACSVNPDMALSVDDLIDHSAFADLILCDAREMLGAISLRELLSDTHCPVLLIPENPQLPKRAVLCFDESFSSIYAIKIYSYLFPEWNDLPSYLLTVNPKGDNGTRYDDYLADWLPGHFTQLQTQTPEGNLHRELVNFVRKDDQPTIVIMGAYGRNAISRLFHRSLSNIVIEETNALVFIMHE